MLGLLHRRARIRGINETTFREKERIGRPSHQVRGRNYSYQRS